MDKVKYYVASDYSSHNAKQTLIKIDSRGFNSEIDANNWKDFIKSEEGRSKKEYYLIIK